MCKEQKTEKKKWNWKKTAIVAAGVVAVGAGGYCAYKNREAINGYMKNMFKGPQSPSQGQDREHRPRRDERRRPPFEGNKTQPNKG